MVVETEAPSPEVAADWRYRLSASRGYNQQGQDCENRDHFSDTYASLATLRIPTKTCQGNRGRMVWHNFSLRIPGKATGRDRLDAVFFQKPQVTLSGGKLNGNERLLRQGSVQASSAA